MRRTQSQTMIVASLVGLVLAVIAAVTMTVPAISIVLGVGAAVCGALGILGTVIRPRLALAVLVFSGVAAAIEGIAQTDSSQTLLLVILGAIAYLIAATAYGFVGTAQGVPVWSRTGLLILLLLTVVPYIAIAGLVGILISAVIRNRSIRAA